jgi:SNF2 family DNA or RNA helicase
MGLGKTIQTIGLILAGKMRVKTDKPTLIIAPVSVLVTWVDEIEKHVEAGVLTFFVHHGSTRLKSAEEAKKYSIIFSTYNTLGSEYSPPAPPTEPIGGDVNPLGLNGAPPQDNPFGSFDPFNADGGEGETMRGGKVSILHSVDWFRVVLDEAHNIKNKDTKQAQATYALKSENRWCLTGTPIQNKLEDLFSLLHFLKFAPFDDQ